MRELAGGRVEWDDGAGRTVEVEEVVEIKTEPGGVFVVTLSFIVLTSLSFTHCHNR
jgi:hypothetical protein